MQLVAIRNAVLRASLPLGVVRTLTCALVTSVITFVLVPHTSAPSLSPRAPPESDGVSRELRPQRVALPVGFRNAREEAVLPVSLRRMGAGASEIEALPLRASEALAPQGSSRKPLVRMRSEGMRLKACDEVTLPRSAAPIAAI